MLRDRQVRLLTLVGPPGTGKSRLALAFGHTVADSFPDGVWWVPFASVQSLQLVLPTITQVLGVHQLGRRPLLETLSQALAGHRLLLVIDNFEHLLAGAPSVAELLTVCPEMTVLATSRAALHVSGEHRFIVAPLETPDLNHLPAVSELARVPAVQLFIQRAKAVRPDFELSEANATAVAQLTVRLDGLPLAIELAAARSAFLDPRHLVDRLGSRLSLVADGPRDLPPRQRTLRAAIRWSYDLLEPDQRRVFRSLAVFSGGCTLDAAQAVISGPGEPPLDALGCIATLVDHSLVRSEHDAESEVRLSMLETVREFALEQLSSSDELEHVRQRHARYFVAFGKRIDNPRLDGPDGPELMARATREHDNLRTALQWLIDRGDADACVRLAGASWSFWEKRGHWTEGLRWLESALALDGVVSPAARANALLGSAVMHRERSEFAAAARFARESADLRRATGDVWFLPTSLLILADAVSLAGDPAQGAAYAAEAVALREEVPLGKAWALLVSGHIAAYQSDFKTARAFYDSALELRRGQADNEVDANLLHGIGAVLLGAGELKPAHSMLASALARFQTRGESRGVARTLLSIGALQVADGDVTTAREQLFQSLRVFRELGEGVGVAVCSLLLAYPLPEGMLAEIGENAVRMWARANVGRDMPPTTHTTAWCIAADAPTSPAVENARFPDGLTRREVQILRLLSRRFTNREIADALVLSPRTVERHIANIYEKTSMTSRRQAEDYLERIGHQDHPAGTS